MTPPSIAAILAERPDHGLGLPVDDGEQHAGCPVGNPPALLPLLYCPNIETETVGELLSAQPQPLTQGYDPLGRGIVDDPARQARLPANMVEDLAQSSLDLTSEPGALRRHRPEVSFLIAATSRDSALVSAGVRSSRFAFA